MNNYKFVFLILHYVTIEDTKKCVNSIFEMCSNNNVDIVIVDNASPNKTGIELENFYLTNEKVHVIVNKKNYGFSKGNNIGFKYAKEKLSPDFIVMCNNDTYLLQKNFVDLVVEEFKNSSFSVLGPKIQLPNNIINPVNIELANENDLKIELSNYTREYVLTLLHMKKVYYFIRGILGKIFRFFFRKRRQCVIEKETIINKDYNVRYENIILHGCFLIFSKIYIDKFDGLEEKTFLYKEEDFLALRLKRNNLKSVYNPNLIIFHNEDSSTNAITKNNRKKLLFVYKNLIKAIRALLNDIKNNK